MYEARFGYGNQHRSNVEIPVGSDNRFNPAPQDRGQPSIFSAGRHTDVFRVRFDGSKLTWSLAGKKVVASKDSKRCADTCDPATVTDNNPCTADSCVNGLPQFTPRPAGTSCSDGDSCNGVEACTGSGQCNLGVPPPTNDGNPCTVDGCSPISGVTHTPVPGGASCGDGDLCNGAEVCDAQATCMAGTPPMVDDGNVCTADNCQPSVGVTHVPLPAGASCSDGNTCNGAETCNQSATCAAGAPPIVDDGNACTADSCDPAAGIVHALLAAGASCSDGDVCNGAELCNGAGQCQNGVQLPTNDGNPCTRDACDPVAGVSHAPEPNGTTCADDDVCNGAEACQSGACAAGTPLAIDDQNPCTADSCSATAGVQHVVLPLGSSCSNGDACDGTELCDAGGTCVAGSAPPADDGNPCTTDSCDPATGVAHVSKPEGTLCDNGNACDGVDQCDDAAHCEANAPPTLDEGNPCTVDACDPTQGVTHTLAANGTPCGDQDACNGAETCSQGTCISGAAPVVEDGNPCTLDSCRPSEGVVHEVQLGLACPDGNRCNGDETCDAGGHCQPGQAPALDDLNPCTSDSCDAVEGIRHTAVAAGSACDDASVCNGHETCDGMGSCRSGTAPEIPPGTPCGAHLCDPVLGLEFKPQPVGTPCPNATVCDGAETCDGAGSCQAGSPFVVPPSTACASYACDANDGIVQTNASAGSPCLDGDQCNGDESCNGAGVCSTGTPPPIPANTACATYTCEPETGVVAIPANPGTPCDNDTRCDGREACDGDGSCVAGTPPVLDDDNPCTTDACDPAVGAVHLSVAQGVSCDDGDACNGTSRCNGAGSCEPGTPPILDDSNPCAIVTCDPAAGVVVTWRPSGTNCDADLNPCNGGATCNGSGECIGTPVPNVDDGNPCTVDSCDGGGSVRHEPAQDGSPCDDGNACTISDACEAAICRGGTPKLCTPAGTCELEGVCEPSTGNCTPTPKPDGAPCDDGNACTLLDGCEAGSCLGGNLKTCSAADSCHEPGACDAVTGACSAGQAKPDGTSCDDANQCNGRERCSAGACVASAPPTIDDANACTTDLCSESGGVQHIPLPIPDDGNSETVAGCDPVTGSVTHFVPPRPPDLTAPALSASDPSSFDDLTRFIFEGPNAIQTTASGGPIDPSVIKAGQGAWLVGGVRDASGAPLSGVTVTIASRGEFGQTLTRADGRFDLVVNGGLSRNVRFEKVGYLPVDRQVYVGWEETAAVDDVAMLSLDSSPATTVTVGAAAPFQVAAGSLASDADGDRGGILMMPAATTATIVMPDGSTVQPSELTLRLTEYTLGEDGPARMPAPLPPTSGYTYAVEISADEAIAAGAQTVKFNQAAFFYLDDFLDIPVGSIVPSGYYDRLKQAWVAAPNGHVIRILQVVDGVATIDAGGVSLSVSTAELQEIARLVEEGRYAVGDKLWRVPIDHLTPWDCNFARAFECDGECDTPPADVTRDDDDTNKCEATASGSIIGCESQSLGETYALPGTPFTLNYRSRPLTTGRRLRINLRPIAANDEVEIEVTLAGRIWTATFLEGPARVWDFTWDSLDAAGRPVVGTATATVQYRWYHTRRYLVPAPSFGATPDATPTWRRERTLDPFSNTMRNTVQVAGGVPSSAPGSASLGGWTIDVQHYFDAPARRLHLGSGQTWPADPGLAIARLVFGSGGGQNFAPDGASATTAGSGLNSAVDEEAMVVAPNGDIYLQHGSRLRRIPAQTATCSPPTALGLDLAIKPRACAWFYRCG